MEPQIRAKWPVCLAQAAIMAGVVWFGYATGTAQPGREGGVFVIAYLVAWCVTMVWVRTADGVRRLARAFSRLRRRARPAPGSSHLALVPEREDQRHFLR